MPAKWQQWMPFRIDAFKSSPAVRAMHPAARSGYLYLLAYAWQTDDCTIPSDPIELAEISEIGDELWSIHGPRILRKFSPCGERLQNSVLLDEWKEAKRVFESRQNAAERTNKHRWSIGDRSVTDRGPNRSADTRTGTVTGTYTETVKEKKHTTRGTRLPKDFLPSQCHEEIAAERHLSLSKELSAFKDHFTAAPGQKGVKLDWEATFRNWLRNSRNGGSNGKFDKDDQNRRKLAEVFQAIDAEDDCGEVAGNGFIAGRKHERGVDSSLLFALGKAKH